MKSNLLKFLLLAFVGCSGLSSTMRAATTFYWGPGVSGSWGAPPANWTPLGPPTAPDTADFSGAGNHIVDLGGSSPFTIDSITFGGGLADQYNIVDSSNWAGNPAGWTSLVTVNTAITKNGLSVANFYGTYLNTTLLTMSAGYLRIAETNRFYALAVNINGGILCAGATTPGASVCAGSWNVCCGGTLNVRGGGTACGPVTVNAGGTLGAGCSVGTATIQGDLVFNPGSSTTFELAAPNVVGVVNDLFNINGNLTLGGSLDVVAQPNFGAGVYRLYNYTGALNGPLPAFGTMPANYNYFIDTATAGQVNLIVSPRLSLAYTNTIAPGWNLIANQLDHAANTLNDVLQGVPDGSQVYKWVEASQSFHSDTYSALDGIWMDGSSGTPSSTTLGARETVFLANPLASAYQLVFTGETRSQTPPPVLSRNHYHYLSGPVLHSATYSDITGLAPEEGCVFLGWHAATQSYQTNRWKGGRWEPDEPVAAIGSGVAVWLPQVATPTLAIGIAHSGTNVEISWPAEAASYQLEAADNLTGPKLWLPVDGTVQVANGRRSMAIAVAGQQRFFRLNDLSAHDWPAAVGVANGMLVFDTAQDYYSIISALSQDQKEEFVHAISSRTNFSALSGNTNSDLYLKIDEAFIASILNTNGYLQIGNHIYKIDPFADVVRVIPSANPEVMHELDSGVFTNALIRTYQTSEEVVGLVENNQATAGRSLFCGESGCGERSAQQHVPLTNPSNGQNCGWMDCYVKYLRLGVYFSLHMKCQFVCTTRTLYYHQSPAGWKVKCGATHYPTYQWNIAGGLGGSGTRQYYQSVQPLNAFWLGIVFMAKDAAWIGNPNNPSAALTIRVNM